MRAVPHLVERSWIDALPKAEVHLHLEGCLEPGLIRAAARRHHVAGETDGAARAPRLTSLAQLLSYLDWSCGLIDEPDDLAATAYGAARRASQSGVGHIDVIVNPTHWPHWRGRLGDMVDALDRGFADAQADGFATATLCVSLKRTQTRTEADALVDWMLERRHPRVAALSVDGDESAGSHTERFVDAFTRAARGGLHRCAHAGESSGPEGVRQAIDLLGAERIDHGVRAAQDPALMAELARRSVPLDICPTSNVVLGIVPEMAAHPVEQLRRHGVRISLNTDDPVLYGSSVAAEYAVCADTFGWGRAELTAVARTSIESCFADEGRRQQLLRALEEYSAS